MEVAVVEGGATLQALPIEDADGLVLPGEEVFGTQLQQAAVDVNGRETERFAQLRLRERQGERAVGGNEAGDFEADMELTEEMGDLLGCRSRRGASSRCTTAR